MEKSYFKIESKNPKKINDEMVKETENLKNENKGWMVDVSGCKKSLEKLLERMNIKIIKFQWMVYGKKVTWKIKTLRIK